MIYVPKKDIKLGIFNEHRMPSILLISSGDVCLIIQQIHTPRKKEHIKSWDNPRPTFACPDEGKIRMQLLHPIHGLITLTIDEKDADQIRD